MYKVLKHCCHYFHSASFFFDPHQRENVLARARASRSLIAIKFDFHELVFHLRYTRKRGRDSQQVSGLKACSGISLATFVLREHIFILIKDDLLN